MLSSSERAGLRLRTLADNNILSHFNITFFNSNFTVISYFWQRILVFHYGDDTVSFSVDLLKQWGNLIFNEYSNDLFFQIYVLKISRLQKSWSSTMNACISFTWIHQLLTFMPQIFLHLYLSILIYICTYTILVSDVA